MANSITHAELPYPIRGARFSLPIPYLDADGDPTDPTTPDTEISRDNGPFVDCAEEVTVATGSNGAGYITLTGAETDCGFAVIAARVASGPKATLLSVVPRRLPVVASGTASAGAAGSLTLGTILAYDITGCILKTTGGTGGGGTGGANNQARVISAYNTSTGVASVAPNWEITPDNTTTYEVLLPDGMTLGMLRALNPSTAGRTLLVSAGGEASLADGHLTAAKFATNCITADKLAADVTTELQAGLATAASLDTVAGYIDTEITSLLTDVGTLLTRLSATRAGYLDNLSAGAVATQASVNTIDDFLDTEIADIIARATDIQSRLPATLSGGRMRSDVEAVSGDTAAADELEAAFDGTAGPVPLLGIVDQGTAQSATSTTIVLRAAAAFGDDVLNGMTIGVFGSTQGYWQFRTITDYVGSTDTATVDAWSVTPSGTITYKIFGTAPASGGGSAPTAAQIADAVWDEALSGHATAGSAGEALSAAGTAGDPWTTTLPGAYGAGTAGNIIGNNLNATVSSRASQTSVDTVNTVVDRVEVDTQDIQARIPAALVGGKIDATVDGTGMQAGAVSAIQSGLATSAQATTIAGYLDTEIAQIITDLGTLLTRLSATRAGYLDNLAGGAVATAAALDTVDNLLDTEIADIVARVTDLQSRVPAALVGGRMDSSIGAMEANTLTASALATDAAQEIRDAVAAKVVETEGSYTIQQVLSIILAVLAGRNTGGTFLTPNGNATRAAITYADGNRSASTLTPSA